MDDDFDVRNASLYGVCPRCGSARQLSIVTTVVAGVTRTHREMICRKGCQHLTGDEWDHDEWDHDEHYGRTHGP